VNIERRCEEVLRGRRVSACRDVHIDDLAELIDGPIHVPPPAGDGDVGLVDIPAITDGMATRTGRVDQQRREALHPPIDRDVINLDPPLAEQLFDVAVRQPIAQVPTDREDDHLGRESETLKRRTRQ
jgi:hypothetical protein